MVLKIEVLRTETCPFCEPAAQLVKKIAQEFGDKVEVAEVDINSEPGASKAKLLSIISVPTILINNMITFVGVPKEENLRGVIQQKLSEEV